MNMFSKRALLVGGLILAIAIVAVIAIMSRGKGQDASAAYGYGKGDARVNLEVRKVGDKKFLENYISVAPGTPIELRWSAAKVDKCVAVGGWTRSTSIKLDPVKVGPQTYTRGYQVTCQKKGVDVTWDQVWVNVTGGYGYR